MDRGSIMAVKKAIEALAKKKKDRDEVDQDLKDEISINDSLEARVEVLLVQILRELQRIK